MGETHALPGVNGYGGVNASIISCADCGRSLGFIAMAASMASSRKGEYLLRKDLTAGFNVSFPARDFAGGGGLPSKHMRMEAPTA